MKDVIVVQAFDRYQPDERVGFPAATADLLIARGLARTAPDRAPEAERVAAAQKGKIKKHESVDVLFVHAVGKYQPGDRAGFSPQVAEQLCSTFGGKRAAAVLAPEAPPEVFAADIQAEPAQQVALFEEGKAEDPPWPAGSKPSKEEFVGHYKASLNKDAILQMGEDQLGLSLDKSLQKGQLLSLIYDALAVKDQESDAR